MEYTLSPHLNVQEFPKFAEVVAGNDVPIDEEELLALEMDAWEFHRLSQDAAVQELAAQYL